MESDKIENEKIEVEQPVVTENVENEESKVAENVATTESKKEIKIKLTKKTITVFVAAVILILIILTVIISSVNNSRIKKDSENLYNTLKETSNSLDTVADEIYNCWYGYVYEKTYKSVDAALLAAYINESDTIKQIKENDVIISDLLQKLKDENYKKKNENAYNAMLDAYDSYKEYYEFVINVSGSFNTYSSKKEEIKKDVKSYLSKYERNI